MSADPSRHHARQGSSPSGRYPASRDASSATRSASRRVSRSSRSSSASARPRSGSIATRMKSPSANLQTILNSLSRGRTNQIIRAYSYFSHLANLAEDQHHVRRSRAHAMAGAIGAAAPGGHGRAMRSRRAQEAGIKQARSRGLLRLRPRLPGPDRASDRSAPQEHHRSRDGGVADSAQARPPAPDPGGRGRHARRRCGAPS